MDGLNWNNNNCLKSANVHVLDALVLVQSHSHNYGQTAT